MIYKAMFSFSLLLFLLAAYCVHAQTSPSGFYVVIQDKTGCLNLVEGLTGINIYCLPKAPVIPETEFESVTKVMYDKVNKVKYVDLTLTADGFKILKTLTSGLPDASLALVLQDRVVGIFDRVGKMLNRTIPISGAADAPQIDWIHDKLKKKP